MFSLQSYRSLPTSYNMERLEKYTQEGIGVMKTDFERTKEALQKENEDYVRERMYLSPEGKTSILREAEKGEFMMPNQQARPHRGISSRLRPTATGSVHQKPKGKFSVLTRNEKKNYLGNRLYLAQRLSGRASEAAEPNVGKDTTKKDFSHLSAEQQERYAQLTTMMVNVNTQPAQDNEPKL